MISILSGNRFRPLDGESISKLLIGIYQASLYVYSFRPLDGESISKRTFPVLS